MTSEITAPGLILSGALDIRHRYIRLLVGLNEAAVTADHGTRAVLRALITECQADLTTHADAVRSQVVAAKAAAKTDDPNQWPARHLEGVVQRAVAGFTGLAARHQAVYQQLHASRQVREDLKYLLYRAMDLSLISPRHEAIVSLKTSGVLEWESRAFFHDGVGTAAIAVPWLESLSPLRWPLVAHELGHYFFPFGDGSTDWIAEQSDLNGWNADAFAEVLADAVAERHFGPSYAFALAREGYLYSYRKHVTGGLSVDQRLRVLAQPEDLIAALPEQWRLTQRESLTGSETAVDDGVTAAMRSLVVEELRDVGDAHEWTSPNGRPDAVEQARLLMRQPEPAPAVRRPQAAERVVAALQARTEDPTANVEDVIDVAVHDALTDAEIFEAAWREEVSQSGEKLVGLLSAPLTPELVEHESTSVARADIWLARSLQSAAVHRWLLRALSDADDDRAATA